MSPKTSQQKFDCARSTYIRVNDKRFADLEAGTTVLIPSPRDIGALIEELDNGETMTLTELRGRLAERHGADGSCPVMTGMHLRIVADLGIEALDAGTPAEEVLPFWEVIEPTSALAKRLPGGPERISRLRAGKPG